MPRRANRKPPSSPSTRICFLPHEFARLKRRVPGPSGKLGGYQNLENWLIDNTDPVTLCCDLPPEKFDMLCRYCKRHGPGGPNSDIRSACVPPLRRIGIDLFPEWRAPSSTNSEPRPDLGV